MEEKKQEIDLTNDPYLHRIEEMERRNRLPSMSIDSLALSFLFFPSRHNSFY
jgi:hypothetical protein